MDQSFFSGPGNIYRAEILLKAGVHPEILGKQLDRSSFDKVWHHTVDLLRRGYATGSILTVDPEDERPGLRRYIYNSSKCGKCGSKVKSWDIAGRTCYACESCQPRTLKLLKSEGGDVKTDDHKPFSSHCAKDSIAIRLERGGARLLTVAEIRLFLLSAHSVIPAKGTKKAALVTQLDSLRAPAVSSMDAAKEKADAGEARNVEHIAELAPVQARLAVKKEVTPSTPPVKRKAVNTKPSKKKKKTGDF